jgi:adenine/guanine/hypoxanthine permease
MSLLQRLFRLNEHGTSVRTELLAGVTTFLTMSYIVFINPAILGTTGMDPGAVFVATCLAAAIGSAVIGLAANYPVGMAPGMGLNAFFAFTVVGAAGLPWQQALAAVLISGIVFLLLSLTGARRWLVDGIPASLRSAIVAGIGLFLAIIALQKSGVVVGDPDTLVKLGPMDSAPPLLALGGFLLIAILEARRVRGAILIGILSVTAIAWAMGLVQWQGLMSLPPSLAPTFGQLDLAGLLHWQDGAAWSVLLQVVLVFVLVEVFDATGTLYGVASRAGLLKLPHGDKRFSRALLADSTAIVAGSVLGTSSTTAFAESASGVEAGGRTGLTALVIAALFLAAGVDGAALRHRPCPAVRGRVDAARAGGDRVERADRSGAGRPVRTGHALHLFHRQRPGLRLHCLCRAQGRHRQVAPGAPCGMAGGRAVRPALRAGLRHAAAQCKRAAHQAARLLFILQAWAQRANTLRNSSLLRAAGLVRICFSCSAIAANSASSARSAT